MFNHNTGGYTWTWPNNQPDNNYVYWNWWGNCPNCNNLYQWGNKFCPNCGHQLIQEETEADKLEKILAALEEMKKELQSLSETAKVEE